jgi:hypothetical protein
LEVLIVLERLARLGLVISRQSWGCSLPPRCRFCRQSDNLVSGHTRTFGRMTLSKLISWNIGSRVKHRRSAQLEWIASEQADVLALQEVAGASDLQQRLSALGFGILPPLNQRTVGRS